MLLWLRENVLHGSAIFDVAVEDGKAGDGGDDILYSVY